MFDKSDWKIIERKEKEGSIFWLKSEKRNISLIGQSEHDCMLMLLALDSAYEQGIRDTFQLLKPFIEK